MHNRTALYLLIALLALACVQACAGETARAQWFDQQSPMRRIVYLDSTDLTSDLVDFPLVLRFSHSELGFKNPDASDIVVVSGSDGKPLSYQIEYCDPKAGVVLCVTCPKIQAGSLNRIEIYYGGESRPKCEVKPDSDIVVRFDAASRDSLLLGPTGATLAGSYKPKFEPGLIRPAMRVGKDGIFQVNLPKDSRDSEQGWTVECIAYNDDPNVRGNFHGEAIVSAWPGDSAPGSQPGNGGVDFSGYKWNSYAPEPPTSLVEKDKYAAEHMALPLINFGLVSNKVHTVTKVPGGHWQPPVFGKEVASRKWYVYSAYYKIRESRIYVNGETQFTGFSSFKPISIGSICIGSWNRPEWVWHGLIDSVRIIRGVPSDDWIRARGMSLSGNPRFLMIGPVESRDSSVREEEISCPLAIAPSGLIRRYEQPGFRWSAAPGAGGYEITVWPSGAPDKPLIHEKVSGTRFTSDYKFEAGKSYQWQVKALADGRDSSSQPTEFSIPVDPKADTAPLDAPNIRERMAMRSANELLIGKLGPVADRFAAARANWVLNYPKANPDIIKCLRDHFQIGAPWGGESYGKFMTGAALFYKMTRDSEVKALLDNMIVEGIAAQEPDGYLGNYTKEQRFTGTGLSDFPPDPFPCENWDLYVIHHELTAFLEYYKATGNENALRSAMHLADLVCEEYGRGKANILDTTYPTITNNYCVLVPLVQLYTVTGRTRYLDMAKKIVWEWESLPAGMEYVTLAGQGKPLTSLHYGHGFEMTISFGGIIDLYDATGDKKLLWAALHWWRDMVDSEMQINGSFCAEDKAPWGEFWVGNRYLSGGTECCMSTSFMRFSTKVLMATGDSECVDAIEKSLYNAHFAAQLADGTNYVISNAINGSRAPGPWDTYGVACCPAWGLAGMGSIASWGATVTNEKDPALVINYYGSCSTTTKLANRSVQVVQTTRYPSEPDVDLEVRTDKPGAFPLWLRIPQWSKTTSVWVNGERLENPSPGSYLKLNRKWNSADKVRVKFDFMPRIVEGKMKTEGKMAIYYGPLLLAIDKRFNPDLDMKALPSLPVKELRLAAHAASGQHRPWVMFETKSTDGKDIVLCDMASTSTDGTEYAAWIPCKQH